MRGRPREDLSGRERQRLLAARDRREQAQVEYDDLFLALVDQHGAGAVARALDVTLQTVHERAKRLRGS